MRRAAAILIGVIGLSCTLGIVAARDGQRRAPTLVVVQAGGSPAGKARGDDKVARTLVAVLPRTKLEVWRVGNGSAALLASIRRQSDGGFVEAMAGIVTAVPIDSDELPALPADDRDVVARLTKGAARGSFRVTTARPPRLTMDLLDGGLARSIVIPLLDGALPTYRRGSLGAAGPDNVAWSGRTTEPGGDATLIAGSLGATGNIRYHRQTYSIWPLSSGRHLIIRTGGFPPDHPKTPGR